MDAIDALMCFGFGIIKSKHDNECYFNNGTYIVFSNYIAPKDKESVKLLDKEIAEQPEYYKKQLRQRGIELGI